MKVWTWTVVTCLVASCVGCSTRHSFSRDGSRYLIANCLDGTTKIKCQSENLPGGVIVISIARGRHFEEVRINNERLKVWARTEFRPYSTICSVSGIRYSSGPNRPGLPYGETRLWCLDPNNTLILKEEFVRDERSGELSLLGVYGPFGVLLEPH